MPFKKNDPKPPGSGRKKETLNRKTRELAQETFDRLTFNPIERLCVIARQRSTPLELRIRALAELARYHSPRLASTVIKAEVTGELTTRRINELAMNPEMAAAMEQLALALAAPTPAALPSLPDPRVIDVEPAPPAEADNQ